MTKTNNMAQKTQKNKYKREKGEPGVTVCPVISAFRNWLQRDQKFNYLDFRTLWLPKRGRETRRRKKEREGKGRREEKKESKKEKKKERGKR